MEISRALRLACHILWAEEAGLATPRYQRYLHTIRKNYPSLDSTLSFRSPPTQFDIGALTFHFSSHPWLAVLTCKIRPHTGLLFFFTSVLLFPFSSYRQAVSSCTARGFYRHVSLVPSRCFFFVGSVCVLYMLQYISSKFLRSCHTLPITTSIFLWSSTSESETLALSFIDCRYRANDRATALRGDVEQS